MWQIQLHALPNSCISQTQYAKGNLKEIKNVSMFLGCDVMYVARFAEFCCYHVQDIIGIHGRFLGKSDIYVVHPYTLVI
jgi:hypothetical protein